MNIYEQLVAIRSDLLEQDAPAKTLSVMDKMIARAVSQRDSAMSVSRLQVLRHVMSTPEVLNDEDIRLDFLALQGDLEDAAAQRTDDRPAYEEDRKPKLKKYYKKK
jgi:hypothetical protein